MQVNALESMVVDAEKSDAGGRPVPDERVSNPTGGVLVSAVTIETVIALATFLVPGTTSYSWDGLSL